MNDCIDVSSHQGIIDWPSVAKSGIKSVIIRVGYGNSAAQIDKKFLLNIKGAIKSGLKIGLYWFGYPDSVADALKEWNTCKQIIDPYKDKMDLFIAYDYEYDSIRYFKRVHGKAPDDALINQMVNAFLSAAKEDGWEVALYTNNDFRKNVFTAATMERWPIWLADYTNGPDIQCDIQQTTSRGQVTGISGFVDMNTCFKDYSAKAPGTPAKPATPALGPSPRTYTVRAGDCLSMIGDKMEIPWRGIASLNGIPAPYTIHAGQVLKLPGTGTAPTPRPAPSPRTYTVKKGESLWELADRFLGSGTRYKEIKALNRLSGDTIFPGQVLKIPN